MRKTLLPIAAALFLAPAAAGAQLGARVSAGVEIDLPVVLPPPVVISPGIRVVPDLDHEVFVVNGVYWARHPNGWYRSRSHRGGWTLAPTRVVPAGLVRLQPGKYKRWKAAKQDHGVRDHGRGEGRKGGGRGGGDEGHGKGNGKHGGKHGKH